MEDQKLYEKYQKQIIEYLSEDDLNGIQELIPEIIPITARFKEVKISTWNGLNTTLLHIAAGFGSEFCVPYLLSQGADPLAVDADFYDYIMEFLKL